MRTLAIVALGSASLLMTIAAACTPFTNAGNDTVVVDPDAANTTSSSPNDAAGDSLRPVDTDGSTAVDGGDGGKTAADAGGGGDGGVSCFDFQSSANGFALTGGQQIPGQGIKLVVSSASDGFMKRTFMSANTIARTDVQIDLTASLTGSFGASTYVDLISLYYGDPPTYLETALSSVVLAAGNKMELNVWYAPGAGSFDGNKVVNGITFPTNNAPFAFALNSIWSSTGRVDVHVNDAGPSIAAKTTTSSQKKVTLVIGGGGNSAGPELTMTIRTVCITLY